MLHFQCKSFHTLKLSYQIKYDISYVAGLLIRANLLSCLVQEDVVAHVELDVG